MIIKKDELCDNFKAFINARGLKDGDEVRPIDYNFFISDEAALHRKEKSTEPFHIYLWKKYKVYTDEEIEDKIRKEKEAEKKKLETLVKYKDYLRSV